RRGVVTAVDARGSGAAAGRSRSGSDGAGPPARYVSRYRAAAATVDAVAAARPPRLGAGGSVARPCDAWPGAEGGRRVPPFAQHRPCSLRTWTVLSPGWRRRDRPRAHLESGVSAARGRRSPAPRAPSLALEH